MTWAPGPVVTRRRLGGELKRLRLGSGLLLEDVARKLECSPSKISRLENGKGIPRWRDVRDMLEAYGLPHGELHDQLLEWSRTGRAPTWWRRYSEVLSPAFAAYLELEWDAARIQAYESHLVHGLLQTEAYASAVLNYAWGGNRSASEIAQLVEVRMKRQLALREEHGLAFLCVLDESSLYRMVGGREVLAGQIAALMDAVESGLVDLRVVPFTAGLAAPNIGSFAKLDFAVGLKLGLVHVETPDGVLLNDEQEVAAYEARLAVILAAATAGDDLLRLLHRAGRRARAENPDASRSGSDQTCIIET